MAQLADFISRIFSSGRTQGLSGAAEMVVDADPAAAFYVARLRRHQAESDYVDDAAQLWSTTSFGGRRGGLRAHIQAERGDGIASFTDVLIVVSQADARRAAAQSGEAWTERTARTLGELFTDFCGQERFELLYGTRPLRFRLVADGGRDMLSHSYGLEAGEFITGLLPNLYVGPAQRSRPVLAVHLNLPGVWEGYREVGRLYSDQIVFTLGRHWLDNYAHPGLREPGIYRLQQYPDGSLVHVISPELQDRYYVRSDQTDGGPSVLTIAEISGRPVAFLVLAVVESMTVELSLDDSSLAAVAPPTPKAAAKAVSIHDAPEPKLAMPPTMSAAGLGQKQRTIVPDAYDTRILTLHERGALLQKVHFSNFMEGYDVYLGPKAQVATSASASSPRAVLQVRFGRVSLLAREGGVRVDNRALESGQTVVLKGTVSIEIDAVKVEYHDLSGIKADGWPYLGELRRPGAGTYLDFGATYQLGRDRRSKVRLPDEPHNENIAWLPSVGGGATIRSRTGDIQKSRFYTDSIMVASSHAELDLTNEPSLRSLARHCFTYVRRGKEVFALFPREGAGGRHEVTLQANDEVLVGNCLFQVSYAPAGGAPATSMPPPAVPKFTANDLASIADGVRPDLQAFATVDPVQPGMLGGPPPRPVRDSKAGASRAKKLDAPSVPGADLPEDAPPPPVKLDPRDLDASIISGVIPRPPKAARGDRSVAQEPEATPAASPSVAAPMLIDDSELDPVVSVEEQQWQQELSRPARLVQTGWSVHGEFTVGNHRGVDMIVPEVKSFAEQAFMTLDYVRIYARGKKGRIELAQEGEASLVVGSARVRSTDVVKDARIEIVRRDANMEPDFDVTLRLTENPGLPDPRAQLLEVDTSDRLVAGLFTTGLPLRSARMLRLGPITASVTFDGHTARVEGYLSTYRTGATGFVPFFLREGGKPWRTMPEDGTAVELRPGDGLLAGTNVYRFEVA